MNEAVLASRLLGGLETFNDAPMDEILDLRARLQAPRVRFRAAVSEATRGILNADDIEAAATAYYREFVAPAMLELDEIVEDLGARATLRRSQAGAVTSLGIGAAGFLSFSELIAAAVVPIGSAAGRELEVRRELQVRKRRHGYFFMWQVDRHLRNARDRAR